MEEEINEEDDILSAKIFDFPDNEDDDETHDMKIENIKEIKGDKENKSFDFIPVIKESKHNEIDKKVKNINYHPQLEKYLYDFVEQNYKKIDNNLVEIEPNYRLIINGSTIDMFKEFLLDFLAKDANGNYFVIEVKKDSYNISACVQLLRYMCCVKKYLAKEKQVYGILICDKIDNWMEELREYTKNIKIFKYNINFILNEI